MTYTRILLAPTTLNHVDIALVIFEMMEMAILSKATHSLTNNEARYEKMKKAAGPERGNPPLQSLLAPSQAQVKDLRNFARFCDKY